MNLKKNNKGKKFEFINYKIYLFFFCYFLKIIVDFSLLV